MATISEVGSAIVQDDLEAPSALVDVFDCAFDVPALRFGVLDDHSRAGFHVGDRARMLIEVPLVVVALLLSFELSLAGVDGLIGRW